MPLTGPADQEIPLPGDGEVGGLSGRSDDPELFYSYQSFLTPPSVLQCDLDSGAVQPFRQPTAVFDRSRYDTRQVFFASKDGTRIPMYVTARKDLKLDGRTPLWLYGYGGFNIALMPEYAPAHLVWLEMGGAYAQVNLRGAASMARRGTRRGRRSGSRTSSTTLSARPTTWSPRATPGGTAS